MEPIARLLSVARGDSPADCVFSGARLINTFTGEIEEDADVAVVGGKIAGVGRGYAARERVDLSGLYLAPGLIDAHVHIESSLCVPAQFAAAVLPRGVTAVVTDPHEIANVAGMKGVTFMAFASRGLPLDVTILAPSCVPATSMATTGGKIDADDVVKLAIQHDAPGGLAEVMNFPGVIFGDTELLEKIACARVQRGPVDGHCPGLVGKALNAYIAAGIGSDHEAVTPAEAKEKLARGLYLLIREATNARNLDALLPVVTSQNARRVCFCTDDRTPPDLVNVGSVDHMVRRAIARGIDPIEAIRMATLNPAEWFGLRHLGAIAPGRLASFFAFEDLRRPEAKMVFARGRLVARDGVMVESVENVNVGHPVGQCHVNWDRIRWDVPAKSSRVRVIGSLSDQLLTEHRVLPAKSSGHSAVADVSRDLLKMMVIERHRGTGNVGHGFLQGFGLRRGAIAGTVAHDHHNLVSIGADDLSMQSAARAAAANNGGLAVAVGEHVMATLPLPVGGLMSDRPLADVARGYSAVVAAARELGSPLNDPFMAMSFMALEVIPALKLTDQGLVDVEQFKIVELFV
jgi:adenine deaminase